MRTIASSFCCAIASLFCVTVAHAQEMASLPPSAPPMSKVRVMPPATAVPQFVPQAPWQDALPGRFPKRLHAPPSQWRDDNVPPTAFLRLHGWGTQRWLQDEIVMQRMRSAATDPATGLVPRQEDDKPLRPKAKKVPVENIIIRRGWEGGQPLPQRSTPQQQFTK